MSKYFYDKQIRRYLLQIARMFSGYEIFNGYEKVNGESVRRYRTVPVTHANISKIGANYLSDNSENMLNSAPAMAFYISDLQPFNDYRQYQHFVSTSRVIEKDKDENGNYINKPARKYDIHQNAPTPFEMKINLDIWTTSLDQKMEIFEQIAVYFNPGYEFLVTSSRFDMGRKSNIELESVQWTSKTIPIGTSTDIDYMTLTFKVFPVYISAPAKITRQNIIKSAHITGSIGSELGTLNELFNTTPMNNIYISPTNHTLEITKENTKDGKLFIGRLQEIGDDKYYSWNSLFKLYGVDKDNSVTLRVRQHSDSEITTNDVYASVRINPDNEFESFIDYDIDTFKPNTLQPIDRIVSGTNNSETIFDSENGTRLMVGTAMINNDLWGIEAEAGTILEKINGKWEVVLKPSTQQKEEFILNKTTMDQYKFVPELGTWQPTTIGNYKEGYWSFDVQRVVSV